MSRIIPARIHVMTLALLLTALSALGQDSGLAAPIFKETDPYEKPDRKTPSMWHRPSADTPAEQLALATRYESEKRRSRAISANRSLVHKWHNSPEAVVAQRNLARLLEESGSFEDAFLEYQYLVIYFSGQFPFLDTVERQCRCANSLCTDERSFRGVTAKDISGVRRMYERILINGPNWTNAPYVALRIGHLQEVEGNTAEAIAAYELVQNRFPASTSAREAAYRTALNRSQFAIDHPRDAQSRIDAVSALHAFLRKFPGDALSSDMENCLKELERQTVEAAYGQAVFYDRNRNDRPAALAAYRDFLRRYPDAPQAKAAAARMKVLERRAILLPWQGGTNAVIR